MWSLLLALGCGSAEPEPPPAPVEPASPPVSVVLVTLDTLRGDRLGHTGYFRDTSPALDSLAGVSVTFTDAQAPMGTTLPSHRSLLTGAWPLEHGLLGNFGNIAPGGTNYAANPAFTSLAVYARAAGFATAGFISAAPLKTHTGIHAGFDTWDEPETAERVAGETVDRALAWLEARPAEQPVFLWVHTFDPHYPYAPPADFPVHYETDEAHLAWLREHQVLKTIPASIPQPDGTVVRERLDSAAMNNAYDREIRYLDSQLARLFQGLQQQGLWDSAALVVVGDHGEGLGQHREWMHGNIHHEQHHTPLILHVPGVAPQRVERPVSTVGALPTALKLAGSPDWAAEWLGRVSVRDLLAPPEGPVFSQRTGDHRPELSGPAWVLDDGRWRYVHEPEGTDTLFDREADPHCQSDVLADEPERAAVLRAQVLALVDAQRARAGDSPAPGSAAPLDPALIEQLRELGYAE